MRHFIISCIALLFLSACGQISGLADNPLTDAERQQLTLEHKLFEAQGEFNIMLSFAVQYAERPDCTIIIITQCSEPTIRRELNRIAKEANLALDIAKANTTGDSINFLGVALQALNIIVLRVIGS